MNVAFAVDAQYADDSTNSFSKKACSVHYQTQDSKPASATKDFDFFFSCAVACAHFITICVADKFQRRLC